MTKQLGQALVEFAIVITVFLLLLLGGMDLLWFEIQKGSVNFITTQAAICNAKAGCDPVAYAKDAATGFNLDPKQMTVTVTAKNEVKVVYLTHPFTGFLHSVTLTTIAITPK